jgi:hypothetical protein
MTSTADTRPNWRPAIRLKKEIMRELRNICGGRFVYTLKTTRGVGD